MCDINVTWQPRRVDWNAHAWTMTTSLYWSLGVVDAVEWAWVLCGCWIQDDWAIRAMNLHQILHKLEHSSTETILMIQKAAAMGSWWLTASSWQHIRSSITSPAEFFDETSSHPSDSAPLQPRFGALNLLAFPKTKISFEREEISDYWWNLGKYDGAADGNWENCVGSQCAYFEGNWGVTVLCTMFFVSSSINVSIFYITWLDTF